VSDPAAVSAEEHQSREGQAALLKALTELAAVGKQVSLAQMLALTQVL